MSNERDLIERIASLSESIAGQAGTASSELAGQIVSVLAANPALIERFMTDGSEMFLEGAFEPQHGRLSWYGQNGQIVTPKFMRTHLTVREVTKAALKAQEAGDAAGGEG